MGIRPPTKIMPPNNTPSLQLNPEVTDVK